MAEVASLVREKIDVKEGYLNTPPQPRYFTPSHLPVTGRGQRRGRLPLVTVGRWNRGPPKTVFLTDEESEAWFKNN